MKTKNIKITHIMSDGTVRDSVKGMIVPRTPETEMFYQLIAAANMREYRAMLEAKEEKVS